MRKLAITVGLLCFATISIVGLKNQQAISLLRHCHTFTIDSTCLIDSVNLELHHNPDKSAATLKQIATLRRIGLVDGDFRAYSLTLHHLGSMYFMNGVRFETLNQRCPKLVKDGCVHGYVMEYFTANGSTKTQTLCQTSTQFRLRVGCFHALGHSYAENTPDSLLSLRDKCQETAANEGYVPCFSGVLHEYVRGSADSHDHHEYYTKAVSLNNLDCNIFSQASLEYSLCYAAIGSFRQYDQYSETTDSTKKLCLKAKNTTAQQGCLKAIYERTAIAHGYSFIPD
jgi:hypothetical protein